MESLSCGKINFTRMGKSLQETSRVPRHSAGIALHASPNVFPWNGPEAILQLTPVSQASPSGSARLVFSGYMGARERDPQRRGLKIGSMRIGSGRTESRDESGGRFGAAKEAFEAAQAFLDALDGSRIRQSQISGSAKGVAGDKRDARFVEQQLGQFGGVLGQRTAGRAVRKMRRNVGERVERAARVLASHTGNCAQAVNDAAAAPGVFREHRRNGIH